MLAVLAVACVVGIVSRDGTLTAGLTFHAGLLLLLALTTKDPLAPTLALSLIYALYSWSCAIYVVTDGILQSNDPVFVTYVLSVLVGQIAIQLGQFAASNPRRAELAPVALFHENRFLILCIVCLTASLWLSSGGQRLRLEMLPYTEMAFEQRLVSRADPSAGVSSYLSELPMVFIIGATILSMASNRVPILGRIAITGVAALFFIQSIRAGSKFEPLMFVIGTAVAVHYSRHRFPIPRLAALVLLCYPFAVMISNVRFTTDIREMFHESTYAIGEQASLLLPSRAGELVGPPQTLIETIRAIHEGSLTFSYGRTYIDETLTWVPRAVWPSRPRPLAEQFMSVFHPSRDAEGRGEAFFIATSGYWAFGLAGVFLEMFAFAAVLTWAHRRLLPLLAQPVVASVYAVGWFWMSLMVVRTGVIGTGKAALMWTVPLLLLLVASRQPKPKRVVLRIQGHQRGAGARTRDSHSAENRA